jgi:hypothetical protein
MGRQRAARTLCDDVLLGTPDRCRGLVATAEEILVTIGCYCVLCEDERQAERERVAREFGRVRRDEEERRLREELRRWLEGERLRLEREDERRRREEEGMPNGYH